MAFLTFILRRATRHWQILLTLSLGVILATALLASGPTLVDTVIEMGLQRTLYNAEPLDAHLRLTAHPKVDQQEYETVDAEVRQMLQERFGEHLDRVIPSTETNWLFPWVGGQLVADQRVNLRVYGDTVNHVDFIAGAWPSDVESEPNVIPVVIGDEMARLYTLRAGDRLPLSLRQKDSEPSVWIEIAGIVRPQIPRAAFWFGELSPLVPQSTQRWSALHSAFVPAQSFFRIAASLFPGQSVGLAWNVLLSHDTFRTDDIGPLQRQLAGLADDLRTYHTRVVLETGLDDILGSYQTQAETIRVPLYILTAEVVLLTLYYVTMVAALSLQQVGREFAILRSRGASGWQLTRIQLLEACLIAGVAFLSGPVLGAALIRTLAWAGPLADIGGITAGLSVAENAWLVAGLGTLACLAGLLLPVGPALRRSIVTHQQTVARAIRAPWWQRYYLDVFVLLVGLILLMRLRLYGELVVGGASSPRLDWLLLLAPLALLLGTATILLRVFPLILRGLARLAAHSRGLSGVLAMWQASRDPTHVARLVLLLTLAIALGVLASGLNATLDQSELERAQYIAGNEVRLLAKSSIPAMELESTPGVLSLAGTWHGQGTVDLKSSRAFPRFEVLAIEPYSFADVTRFRDDYAEHYMGELLGHLIADEDLMPPTLTLPGEPARLGMWLRATFQDEDLGDNRRYLAGDSDTDRIGLVAKLQTAQSELFAIDLVQPEIEEPIASAIRRFNLRLNLDGRETELNFLITPIDDGWRYFEGSLPILPPSSYPLSLHSFWIQNRVRQFGQPVVRIDLHLAMDDISILDSETGATLVAEGFEDPTRIWYVDDPQMRAYFTRALPHTGQGVLGLDLAFRSSRQVAGLKLTEGRRPAPLPALASPTFLETTELEVGESTRVWINSVEATLEIVGTVQHFPTLYEELEAGYIVTSRDQLLPMVNQASATSINLNEAFLETDGQVPVDALASMVPNLLQSWEAESVRIAFKANPLALGLRGVTYFGYVLTALLSLIGFATHFYMSARQRGMQYGVMRAMGMSPRQLYGSLVLEQVILILAGLALGTALGVLLNQITLPRLPIALGDGPPVPPFYPRDDWLAVARIYLILALAFLVTLGVATALLWRARIHRVLRIGQE